VQRYLEAYERVRERVCALAGSWDGTTAVGACPGWTVTDVLAHLVGLARDVVAGDLEGFASDAWTERHVRGADRSVGALCAEWAELARALPEAVADPDRNGQVFAPLPVLVFYDAATHEDDLRVALALPPAEDPDAVRLQLDIATSPLRRSIEDAGLPALRIVADGIGLWDVGDGPPDVSVAASPARLARSFAGRLPRDEVRAFEWTGDAEPYLEHWLAPVFHWPR